MNTYFTVNRSKIARYSPAFALNVYYLVNADIFNFYYIGFFTICQDKYMNFSYNRGMITDLKMIVGENLKAARLAKKMTQKEVAALMNKYQPDYSQYESGKIELDYEKIIFLCKLYDITPNDLFYGLFD